MTDEAIIKLAKAICQAEGKNPDRLYKGRPLWQHSVDFATAILPAMPVEKPPKAVKSVSISPIEYDNKIKHGVQCYIDVFNDGTPSSLGKYVHTNSMCPRALDLHMRSLKAAIAGMIK